MLWDASLGNSLKLSEATKAIHGKSLGYVIGLKVTWASEETGTQKRNKVITLGTTPTPLLSHGCFILILSISCLFLATLCAHQGIHDPS